MRSGRLTLDRANSFTFWIGLLVVWQILSMILSSIYFATPVEVFVELTKILSTSDIYFDIWSTLKVALIGLLVSALIAVPLGIIIGSLASVYDSVANVVDFFRSIPPIVFYPLLLISLGPSDLSRIGTVVIGCSVVMFLIVSKGIGQSSKVRRNFMKAAKAKKKLFKDVLWYESLPSIMVALRTTLAIAMTIVIVSEMLVGKKYGLGVRIQSVQITSNIPDLFATIIIVGLVGLALNKLVVYFDEKFVHWKHQ